MPTIGSLTTLAAGKAYRSEVNGNFTTIRTAVNTYGAFVDAAATITGSWSFTTSPAFPAAVTFALGLTVSASGITVTGNSTITGTLGGLTGLTVASGGITVTGDSTITGTLGGISTCTATTFSGSGASLTNLPAANLTGTIAAISGANVTNLNATNIASGTLATARLPASIIVSTKVAAPLVGGESGQASVHLSDTAAAFLEVGASSATWISQSAPAGVGQKQYIKFLHNSVEYKILATPTA